MSETQGKAQGKVSLPLFARLLGKLNMGSQMLLRQRKRGSPTVGDLGEPGVYPIDMNWCAPDLPPAQLLRNSENRISARTAAPGARYGKDLWAEAMEQVEKVAARWPISF